MKNIVTAVDFTSLTERVVEQAAVLAHRFGAKLWLIHVAAPDPDFVGYEVGPQYIRDERAKELRKEHQQIQDYARQMKNRGIDAEALLIQGPLTRSLLEEAKDVHADLIVIGAHSHSALFDKLFGNTGQELLRQTTIPLLIVPQLPEA